MDFIYLQGTEAVERAAGRIAGAAERMNQAAERIEAAVERLEVVLRDDRQQRQADRDTERTSL